MKIGYFESDSDLRYHGEVHGDLFSQIDGTLDLLLTKYLKALISYEGVQRVERYPIPEVALREILLNAVAHKDYRSSVPIQISVYTDRVLVWNNGQLPDEWTVERLMGKHPSQPFNPDIANAFFRAGMIEAWGRGVEKVIQACRDHGNAPPEWRSEETGLWVEFPVPESGLVVSEPPHGATQKILAILRDNPSAGRREIAEMLDEVSENGIKYHLDKLRATGQIRRVGPKHGGYWEIIEGE